MNNIIKNPIKRFFLKELVRISSTVNTPVVGQSVDDILSNLNSVYVLLTVRMYVFKYKSVPKRCTE